MIDRPSLQSHHVDRGDVIAVEQPIGGWDFRIFEIAITDGAIDGADVWIVAGRTFDGAHANVAEAAVHNVNVARRVLSLHFDSVRPRFGEGQAVNKNAIAVAYVNDVVAFVANVPPFALQRHRSRI